MAIVANYLAEIRPEVLYPLDRFQKIAGLGKWAMRTARKNGLPVRKVGRRKYVRGSDFLAYVEKHGKAE